MSNPVASEIAELTRQRDLLFVAACRAEDAILTIIRDEATQKVGLWQGPFLERNLTAVRNAIASIENSPCPPPKS